MNDYEWNKSIGGQSYADHMDLARRDRERADKVTSSISNLSGSVSTSGTTSSRGGGGGLGVLLLVGVYLIVVAVSVVLAGLKLALGWLDQNWQWLLPYGGALTALSLVVSFRAAKGRSKFLAPEMVALSSCGAAFVAVTLFFMQYKFYGSSENNAYFVLLLPFLLAIYVLNFTDVISGKQTQNIRAISFFKNHGTSVLAAAPIYFIGVALLVLALGLCLHFFEVLPNGVKESPFKQLVFWTWCIVWPLFWVIILLDFLPVRQFRTTWRAIATKMIGPLAFSIVIACYLYLPRGGDNWRYIAGFFYPEYITGYIQSEIVFVAWLFIQVGLGAFAVRYAFKGKFLPFLIGFTICFILFLSLHALTGGWWQVEYLLDLT